MTLVSSCSARSDLFAGEVAAARAAALIAIAAPALREPIERACHAVAAQL